MGIIHLERELTPANTTDNFDKVEIAARVVSIKNLVNVAINKHKITAVLEDRPGLGTGFASYHALPEWDSIMEIYTKDDPKGNLQDSRLGINIYELKGENGFVGKILSISTVADPQEVDKRVGDQLSMYTKAQLEAITDVIKQSSHLGQFLFRVAHQYMLTEREKRNDRWPFSGDA